MVLSIAGICLLGAVGVAAERLTPAASLSGDAGTFAGRARAAAAAAGVPGGAVVVVRDGHVDAIVTLGTRNGSDPVASDTVFRIASVSKVFTAVAAARLVADGRLSLDDDLRSGRSWLAAVAPGADPVTLRDLLTHTAGFDDCLVGMFARDAADVVPLGDYLRAHMPRRTTAPGRWTRYSNHGAALAGLAVEQAARLPFAAAEATLVLEPLGMIDSSFAQPLPAGLLDRMARAYPCPDAGCDPISLDYRNTSPAGGMVTTPADMGRFLEAVLDPEGCPLGAETVDRLTRRAWGFRPELPGMALALQEQTVAGRRALVHAGSSSGYKSLLVLVPEAVAGLFVVTSGGSTAFAADMLAELEQVLGGAAARSDRPPSPLAADELGAYTGTYLMARAARRSYESFPGRFLFAHAVWADPEGYLRRAEGGRASRYGRVDGDLFASVDGPGMLAFERDSSGRVVALHAADVFNGARFPAAYERLNAGTSPHFVNELLSWVVAVPLIALVVRLLLAAVGRLRRRERQTPKTALARVGVLLAAGTAASVVVFTFGFLARFNAMTTNAPERLAYGLPAALDRLLALPWVVACLTVALAGVAVASWWRRSGVRLVDRLLFAVVAVCALVFVAMLVRFSLLPPAA